jgi:hypothetical protein
MSQGIFVFGSNEAGIHGGGAARHAYEYHNAKMGVGVGLTGTSYAIPTKNEQMISLSLSRIAEYVRSFIDYARAHPETVFDVTRIGCGLAGYKDAQIAPMFAGAPDNCHLPHGWRTEYR